MADVDRPDLEHLRHIRGAIDDMRDDIREINQRLGILENQYAGLRSGWIEWMAASSANSI